MSTILELKETPESCKSCLLVFDSYGKGYRTCNFASDKDGTVEDYTTTRHPDCPLKIKPEVDK